MNNTSISSRTSPYNPPDRQSLENSDYSRLKGIDREILQQANVCRVDSLTGGQIVGRNGHSDYSGIIFPYYWPGDADPREYRLRRDNPEMEADANGQKKPKDKYLSPAGRGNLLYFPPGINPAWLQDPKVPIAITEGEKKTLALHGLALHDMGDTVEHPRWVSIGLAGVWNWKGTIGKVTNENGVRVDEKGVIPDFDRIVWKGRVVKIVFDANVHSNDKVEWARKSLAAELRKRGALVALVDIPEGDGINGVDDLVREWGKQKVLNLINASKPAKASISAATDGWESSLLPNKDGSPKACLANAITALTSAPEWDGVLAFNAFTLDIVTLKPPPWSELEGITEWKDVDDIRLADWLQKKGIQVNVQIAGQAVQVASQEQTFHPVRDYLDPLQWDQTPRLPTWMHVYLGAEDSVYNTTIGTKFLISAVSRIYKPGEKVDCVPIIRGGQGSGKSSVVELLFGSEFFTDRISDLTSKDAMIEMAGIWVAEIAEFDSFSKADTSRIKSFTTSRNDRYRAPYGKRTGKVPRQCVFVATVNHDAVLKDETGNRRFWPVRSGKIQLAQLAQDRDQLWAEAVHRYRAGETWWLDTDAQKKLAAQEQDDCYQSDPWDEIIHPWIADKADVSISEILEKCIGKDRDTWSQSDMNRVSRSLCFFRWERFREREGTTRSWRYRPAR
jgi:predicted P-loop ATPase